MKQKGFFNDKSGKTLARLRIKRETSQIKGDITSETTEIQIMHRNYYKLLSPRI
jgi:hypothetical protein